jgi:hypothetical protein
MQTLQVEARKRILDRGKIEFRVEPELISNILDLAIKKNLPIGPMVREWVYERLQQEKNKSRISQLDVIEEKIDQLAAVIDVRRSNIKRRC